MTEEEEPRGTETPLQQEIRRAIDANPSLDDQQIADIVVKEDGRHPTMLYVQRRRRILEREKQSPRIEVEGEPPPETEEGRIREEAEAFEPPLEQAPKPLPEGAEDLDLAFMVEFTFDKLAEFTSWEGWRLDPKKNKSDEQFLIYCRLMIDKYAPNIMANYALELLFSYTAIMIVGGKVKGYQDYMKTKAPKKEETSTEEQKP